MLARIFNNAELDIPENFGVFITKNNIQKHIQFKIIEISRYENKNFYEKIQHTLTI